MRVFSAILLQITGIFDWMITYLWKKPQGIHNTQVSVCVLKTLFWWYACCLPVSDFMAPLVPKSCHRCLIFLLVWDKEANIIISLQNITFWLKSFPNTDVMFWSSYASGVQRFLIGKCLCFLQLCLFLCYLKQLNLFMRYHSVHFFLNESFFWVLYNVLDTPKPTTPPQHMQCPVLPLLHQVLLLNFSCIWIGCQLCEDETGQVCCWVCLLSGLFLNFKIANIQRPSWSFCFSEG